MNLPKLSRLQFTPDLNICRLLNGMWQVSGAHGPIDPKRAIASMFDYFEAGFTTWDLADHYGPAEDFIGTFRQQLLDQQGEASLSGLQAFTKWVPRPRKPTKHWVEDNINLSLQRMSVEALDLLQFHWWDYQNPYYLDTLIYLAELQEAGKIKHLALTNFDTEHLQLITQTGIKIVSNQVQFSLIDRRPQVSMIDFCQQNDIQLLAYGTLCGGLLSETYLHQPEPSYQQLTTASLRKYKQMIDAWGGWKLFQALLKQMEKIASQYQGSLANIAVRYILEQPTVAGAIIGARLGVGEHLSDNAKVFDFQLSPEDYQRLDSVFKKGENLYQLIGDCGDEYRR